MLFSGANIKKGSARHAIDSLVNSIAEELTEGADFTLVGFGAFKVLLEHYMATIIV